MRLWNGPDEDQIDSQLQNDHYTRNSNSRKRTTVVMDKDYAVESHPMQDFHTGRGDREPPTPPLPPLPSRTHGASSVASRSGSGEDAGVVGSHESGIFNDILRPDDAYDETGTYWADMDFSRRLAFVNKVNNEEAKREFNIVWDMFRNDPLSPFGAYFRNMVLPGVGIFLEGYVLFSIGNVTPLLRAAFPECWRDAVVCDRIWLQGVQYLQIVGIIIGQIFVGIVGDMIGRRWGMIQDASIMFVGLVMLTASWGADLNGWVVFFVWALFVYGVGIGGEYPMTAASGMEMKDHGRQAQRDDRLHRGRKVTGNFTMQGWGQLSNQLVLIASLLIFNKGVGAPPYPQNAALLTYRTSFAIAALGTLWVVYHRTWKIPPPPPKKLGPDGKPESTYDVGALKMAFHHFGFRLLATGGAWFSNDAFFFGNKIFQAEFIQVLTPGNESVMTGWEYNLINITVSLIGYYLASLTIDHKFYGRRRMMFIGFMADFILFIIPGYNFDLFTTPQYIRLFQAMYFLASFFCQFGPNSVTFIVAAEVYPTQVRATCHGFSAASGKLGALLAAVLYNYIDNQTKFWIAPWFGALGALLTFIFLPDTTGLDLKEQDRRWQYILAGREKEYHGIAVHPKHLSMYERWKGLGESYNPRLDYAAKVDELRAEWETRQDKQFGENVKGTDLELDDGMFTDEVNKYFSRTRSNKGF